MNVNQLAASPVFIFSLGLCALVAAYSVTLGLRTILRKISTMAAFAGLSKAELVSIDTSAKFHEKLRSLIEVILRIEEHSAEAPGVFHDHSWSRLLRLCDDLEIVRGELNQLLADKDFESAAALGRFLCGFDVAIPSIPRPENAPELRLLTFWQRDTVDLLHRMVSRLEDEGRSHDSAPNPAAQFSESLQDAIEDAKAYVDDSGLIC